MLRVTLAVLFWLGFSSTAFAEIVDLSTRTCRQFQTSKPDEIRIILSWLDGYYNGENQPAIIDSDKIIANAKRIGEYCSANPNVGLITATDALFKK